MSIGFVKKDNFRSECAPRITEERERLGLTQEQVATSCAVSREMWGKYERGKAAMGGEYLFSFAALGADANYILTGARSNAAPALRVEQVQAGYSVEVLSKEEQALLDNYRHSPPEGQAAIKTTCAALAKPRGKIKKSG